MEEIKLLFDDNLDEQFITWSQRIQNVMSLIHESEDLLINNKAKVKMMEDEIQNEKIHLHKIESDNETIKEQCESFKIILTDLHKERDSLIFEIKINDPKRYKSIESMQHIEAGHQKLDFYKHLTGIRWDYSLIELFIKGAISNNKDYLQNFKYPIDTADITEKLWDKIYKSIKHHIPNIQNNKENKVVNK